MPITIVSAPPKTAPTAETSGAPENTGSGADFAQVLFGQLFRASSGTDSLENSLGSLDTEPREEDTGEGALSNDPLALLAVLTQAPTETRREITDTSLNPSGDLTLTNNSIAQGIDPAGDKTESAKEADVSTRKLSTLSEMQDLADDRKAASSETTEVSTRTSSLASGIQDLADDRTAAKFAVAAFAASGEGLAGANVKTTETLAGGVDPATSAPGMAHTQASNRTPHDADALTVPTPLRDRDWNNDFAQKVVWLATSHKQAAELTLTPPQMGSIEISLKIDNGSSSATATFVSTNAEVRESIEAALPRLREMLAGVGIDLGQANVSAESFRQQAYSQGNGESNASRSANDNAILAPESAMTVQASGSGTVAQGRGLVDLFA